MFISESFGVNSAGHLTIGGVDSVYLASKYATPLYVMDEDLIRKNCRQFRDSIKESYKGGMVAFASKAFSCKEIYRIVGEEGLGIDVVSGGELYTALKAGFPAEKIIFHGNNKTASELSLAIENGVGRIVVDNLTELELLDALAKSVGKKVNIMFRIKPGIDAHTHDFVKTGQIDSKFGLALETGEAMEAVKAALLCKNLILSGVHCHIGSQIFDVDPFVLAAEVMMDFIGSVKKETGHTLYELNLGGGFGIKYTEDHKPSAYSEYAKKVSRVIKEKSAEYGIDEPFIIIEPGRSIVGSAGATLYTVGSVKVIPNIRTYVSVDGGMTDNPRYALYRSEYEVLIANKASEPRTTVATIAGRCCESGDLLGENLRLQETKPYDILAVLATGAYNYSMSSNYNRVPRPPVVFVSGGKDRLAIKRETYEDIIRNDI